MLFSKRWRKMLRGTRRAQALVEFALVIMLLISTLVGGVLVIQALFLQQRLIDIVARAAEWGASTNNNSQIAQIVEEARHFSDQVTVVIEPFDPKDRPIGSKLTVSIVAVIPMFGPGVALTAQLGASNTALIEHNPMRFATPPPVPITFHVDDYVSVHTTAGESLNVRRTPGIKGSTFFSLFNGGKAIIIDGPVELNGLRWWKIYDLRSKLSGWCVDKADTVDTLTYITSFF